MSDSRAETLFARLGLAGLAAAIVLGLLVLDVVLTSRLGAPARPPPRDVALDLSFRTPDGRLIGGTEGAFPVVLTPATFYENVPGARSRAGSINSRGFRGPELDASRARPRLLVVGGSTAFGLGADEPDAFPRRLALRMRGHEVVNGGVVGYCSAQELHLVVARLLEVDPAVVVALDGWNDLYDAYWWRRFFAEPKPVGAVNSAFAVLTNRLVAYRRVETEPGFAWRSAVETAARSSTLGRLLRGAFGGEEGRPLGGALPEAELTAVLDRYVANLLRLHRVLAGADRRLLVVLQPEAGQLFPGEGDLLAGDGYWEAFPDLYRRFRGDATRALAERGIDVLDGSALFEAEGAQPGWFLDPVHLSGRGSAALAARVAERLGSGSARERARRSIPGATATAR